MRANLFLLYSIRALQDQTSKNKRESLHRSGSSHPQVRQVSNPAFLLLSTLSFFYLCPFCICIQLILSSTRRSCRYFACAAVVFLMFSAPSPDTSCSFLLRQRSSPHRGARVHRALGQVFLVLRRHCSLLCQAGWRLSNVGYILAACGIHSCLFVAGSPESRPPPSRVHIEQVIDDVDPPGVLVLLFFLFLSPLLHLAWLYSWNKLHLSSTAISSRSSFSVVLFFQFSRGPALHHCHASS